MRGRPPHLETRYKHELTQRQREVLELIAKGRTNAEIAEHLSVSLDGAKYHVREIMDKLGAESREEAVEIWRRHKGGLRRWLAGIAALPTAVRWGMGAAAAGGAAAAVIVVIIAGLSSDGPRSAQAAEICQPGDFVLNPRATTTDGVVTVDAYVSATSGGPCYLYAPAEIKARDANGAQVLAVWLTTSADAYLEKEVLVAGLEWSNWCITPRPVEFEVTVGVQSSTIPSPPPPPCDDPARPPLARSVVIPTDTAADCAVQTQQCALIATAADRLRARDADWLAAELAPALIRECPGSVSPPPLMLAKDLGAGAVYYSFFSCGNPERGGRFEPIATTELTSRLQQLLGSRAEFIGWHCTMGETGHPCKRFRAAFNLSSTRSITLEWERSYDNPPVLVAIDFARPYTSDMFTSR